MSKMQRLEERRVPGKTFQEIGRIISRQSQRMKDTRKGDWRWRKHECGAGLHHHGCKGLVVWSKPSLGTSQEKLRRLAEAKNRCQAEREPIFQWRKQNANQWVGKISSASERNVAKRKTCVLEWCPVLFRFCANVLLRVVQWTVFCGAVFCGVWTIRKRPTSYLGAKLNINTSGNIFKVFRCEKEPFTKKEVLTFGTHVKIEAYHKMRGIRKAPSTTFPLMMGVSGEVCASHYQ